MTSRDFCYWLQGYFEVAHYLGGELEPPPLNFHQVQIIRNHLNMVFKHEIDPSHGDKKHQEELSNVHERRAESIKTLLENIPKDGPFTQYNC